MYLTYFNETAYDRLLNEIDNNKEKYLSNNEWLTEYFEDEKYFDKSGIEVSRLFLVVTENATTEQLNQDDLVNTKILYDVFKKLSPLQATNQYMWSYLSHVTFKEYIVGRWMTNPGHKTIITRYFMQGKSGKFNNALSRLWWYGYISYDKKNSNPWHLTETLLMNQQICKDLVDESYSSNPNVVKGMLQALNCIKEENPHKGLTTLWRNCVQYINRQGAVINLDFVGIDKIEEMTYDYLHKEIGE